MKRSICILLSLMLLWCWGIAEEEKEEQMRVCDHLFQVDEMLLPEHEWCIRDQEAPQKAFKSVACIYCDAEGIVFEDKALLEPDPCNAAVCTHRLYRLSEFNRAEWEPVNDQLHQRIEYGVGICVDCGTFGTLVRKLENGTHQLVESEGFHIEGQYIHVIWEECLLCGMIEGDLVPCISYEDLSCERTK